jgi:hypothetical protein
VTVWSPRNTFWSEIDNLEGYWGCSHESEEESDALNIREALAVTIRDTLGLEQLPLHPDPALLRRLMRIAIESCELATHRFV